MAEEPEERMKGEESLTRYGPFLHIIALWSFAAAQPIFDVIGKNAVFLVAHQMSRGQVLLFALAIGVVPPAGLILIEVVVGLASARMRRLLHLLLMGLLLAVTTLPLVGRHLDHGAALFSLFMIITVLGSALLYERLARARLLLTVLSPSILLFGGYFLLATPVSHIVVPSFGDSESLGTVGIAADVPVFMVVLDELPLASLLTNTGEVDRGRLPNFGRLASQSTWYRNATAVHPTTRFSVPSILTGRHAVSSVPIASEYPRNLFSMLDPSHQVEAWELVTQLCRKDDCKPQEALDNSQNPRSQFSVIFEDVGIIYLHAILPESWRAGLPPIDEQWSHFREQATTKTGPQDIETEEPDLETEREKVRSRFRLALHTDHTARFDAFLASVRDSRQPAFQYIHVMLPHRPFEYMPSGRIYSAEPNPGGDAEDRNVWGPDEYLVTQMQQRHLLQVGHVDALLGRLLDTLEQRKLVDNSIVIVTADHGISFEPSMPIRKLVEENAGAIVGVPLFIKYPHQYVGRVDDRNVELIDIAPTLAEVLSVDVDWDFDGLSLLDEGPLGREGKVGDYLGQEFRIPDSLRSDVLDDVARMYERFDVKGGSLDPLSIGPHGDLVGTDLRSRHVMEPSGLRAELVGAEALGDVSSEQAIWPNRLVGRVRSSRPESGLQLVVAVNGVIGGAGETYEEGGTSGQFSIFTSDVHFRPGQNVVRLFEVRGSSDDRSLHEVSVTAGES